MAANTVPPAAAGVTAVPGRAPAPSSSTRLSASHRPPETGSCQPWEVSFPPVGQIDDVTAARRLTPDETAAPRRLVACRCFRPCSQSHGSPLCLLLFSIHAGGVRLWNLSSVCYSRHQAVPSKLPDIQSHIRQGWLRSVRHGTRCAAHHWLCAGNWPVAGLGCLCLLIAAFVAVGTSNDV